MGFTRSAAVYDLMTDPAARLEREGPFLASQIHPEARVLDVACGTGAHARFLAEHGAHVTARDLSPDMIAYARAHRAHPNLTFETGDMTRPPVGPFDWILCLGNSINLLPTVDTVRAALSAWAGVLSPSGRILIQTQNPAARGGEHLRHREGSIDGQPAVVVKSMVAGEQGRLLTLSGWVGSPRNTFSEATVLLDLGMRELADMLQATDLHAERWWGGFGGAPFEPTRSLDILLQGTHAPPAGA